MNVGVLEDAAMDGRMKASQSALCFVHVLLLHDLLGLLDLTDLVIVVLLADSKGQLVQNLRTDVRQEVGRANQRHLLGDRMAK